MPTTTDLLSTILGSDDTQGQFEINLEKTQLSNVWSTLSQALSQTKKFLVSGNTLHITCRYNHAAPAIQQLINSAQSESALRDNIYFLMQNKDTDLTDKTHVKATLINRILNLRLTSNNDFKRHALVHLLEIDCHEPTATLSDDTRKGLIACYCDPQTKSSDYRLYQQLLVHWRNVSELSEDMEKKYTKTQLKLVEARADALEKPSELEALAEDLSYINWEINTLKTDYITLIQHLTGAITSLIQKNPTSDIVALHISDILDQIPADYIPNILQIIVLHYFETKPYNYEAIRQVCVNNRSALQVDPKADMRTQLTLAEILTAYSIAEHHVTTPESRTLGRRMAGSSKHVLSLSQRPKRAASMKSHANEKSVPQRSNSANKRVSQAPSFESGTNVSKMADIECAAAIFDKADSSQTRESLTPGFCYYYAGLYQHATKAMDDASISFHKAFQYFDRLLTSDIQFSESQKETLLEYTLNALYYLNKDTISYLQGNHGQKFPILSSNFNPEIDNPTHDTYLQEKTRYYYHAGCFDLTKRKWDAARDYFENYLEQADCDEEMKYLAQSQLAFAHFKTAEKQIKEGGDVDSILPSLLSSITIFEQKMNAEIASEIDIKILQLAYSAASALITTAIQGKKTHDQLPHIDAKDDIPLKVQDLFTTGQQFFYQYARYLKLQGNHTGAFKCCLLVTDRYNSEQPLADYASAAQAYIDNHTHQRNSKETPLSRGADIFTSIPENSGTKQKERRPSMDFR